jgi:hypothetical protein
MGATIRCDDKATINAMGKQIAERVGAMIRCVITNFCRGREGTLEVGLGR